MESSESESTKTHGVVGFEPDIGPKPSQRDSDRSNAQIWAIALSAGVAAGLISWLAGESVHAFFSPQVFPIRVGFVTYIQPTAASLNTADLKNATLVFTILGGITGLGMGIAGGFARRSLSRGLVVGLGGLAAGGLVGAFASLGLLPFFFRRVVPDPNDLLSPLLIHGGIWMAVGAVSGSAFAIGMKCGRCIFNAVTGACLGAFLATILFHGLGEALFPDSGSTAPVANSASVRLMAVFLVTILIACGTAWGVLGRTRHSAAG
jgi:hypothetical protein